jgi:hypothetical protein
MNRRLKGKPGELRVLYTIPELAQLVGMTRFAMGRLLRRHKVRFVEYGVSGKLVPLVSFRDALPDVWNSIILRLDVTSRVIECDACGAKVDV